MTGMVEGELVSVQCTKDSGGLSYECVLIAYELYCVICYNY